MPPKTPRAGSRTSSRLASKTSPDSAQSSRNVPDVNAENDDLEKKRKVDVATSPSNRPGKKPKAEQKTLEETLGEDQNDQENHKESVEDAPATKSEDESKDMETNGEVQKSGDHAPSKTETNGQPEEKKDDTNGAVEESSQREKTKPSGVLEKGIYYFFARARVDITDPKSVQDIARSYIVLRPLPDGAKLGDGAIDDMKNMRLIALPKKTLPKSSSDRFMAYVEKSGVSVDSLKEQFMDGATYQTATAGERRTQPVTPIAEGVYAITTTGRESHLAYMLTIPNELGEMQKDLGMNEKGSFILSTKNPESKGPSIAQFDNPAEFSKEIMDDFRGRSWMPLQPSHLDYTHAQLLLIGEGQGDVDKATQQLEKDENDDVKRAPEEELELLEDEDLKRVEAMRGDDTIFDDLDAIKKDYPKVSTTW